MKSLLERIKSKKKLSFNHWRYRLIHWTFGCKPKSPDDSPCPRFLYTHYCPMFHLSNMFFVLLPVILIFKTLKGISVFILKPFVMFFVGLAVTAWDAIAQTIARRKKEAAERVPPKDELRAAALQKFKKCVWNYNQNGGSDFEYFWSRNSYDFSEWLTEQAANDLFHKVFSKWRAVDAKRKQREAIIAAMVLWSARIGKVLLAIVAAAALVGACFGLLAVIPAIVSAFNSTMEFFAWFGNEISIWFNENGMWLARVVGMGVGGVVALALLVWTGVKVSPPVGRGLGWLGRNVLEPIFGLVAAPFCLAGRGLKKAGVGIANGIEAFLEFCVTFYENNCPPIEIDDLSAQSVDDRWGESFNRDDFYRSAMSELDGKAEEVKES